MLRTNKLSNISKALSGSWVGIKVLEEVGMNNSLDRRFLDKTMGVWGPEEAGVPLTDPSLLSTLEWQ